MTRPTFTIVRIREGYNQDEVTAFLDEIEPRVHASDVHGELIDTIRNVRFSPVRRIGGFDMAEVDMYLDELEKRVRAANPGWSGRKPTPSPGRAPSPGRPVRAFTTTRFRSGYAIADVDAFLDEIEPLVRGFRPPLDLLERLRAARFAPVAIRKGYDMGEVDQYLDELQDLVTNAAR